MTMLRKMSALQDTQQRLFCSITYGAGHILSRLTINNRPPTRQQSLSQAHAGFTLIELIVTIAVLAIIVSIATPSILTTLANMEAKRVRKDITNTLTTAKAESLIRRQDVTACLVNKRDRCRKNSQESLLLFIDSNNNQKFDANSDTLLKRQALNSNYGSLHLRVGNRHYIRFAGDSGKPRGFFGHIKYCPTSIYSEAMYQVSFSQTGIIRYKPNSMHPTGC